MNCVTEFPRVVARLASGSEQVRVERRDAEAMDGVAIAAHGLGAFRGVGRKKAAREAPGMHERDVHDVAEVSLDGTNVVGRIVAVRLPGLGEEVDDEDPPAPARRERFPHSTWEHACDDAREETSRSEHDQVRGCDCFKSAWRGGYRPLQLNPVDPSARACDRGLAANHTPIREPADELDTSFDGRNDAAADAEQLAGDFHGGAETTQPLRERRQHHVADSVAAEAAVAGESVLEQLGERIVAVSEGDEAIADVTRAGQTVAASDPAGASSVVARGDDAADVEALFEERESAEDGRKTSPAAQGDHAHWGSRNLVDGRSGGKHARLTATRSCKSRSSGCADTRCTCLRSFPAAEGTWHWPSNSRRRSPGTTLRSAWRTSRSRRC